MEEGRKVEQERGRRTMGGAGGQKKMEVGERKEG